MDFMVEYFLKKYINLKGELDEPLDTSDASNRTWEKTSLLLDKLLLRRIKEATH